MKFKAYILFFCNVVIWSVVCATYEFAHAERLHFSTHILGSGAPSVLIVGGIQGDEPGGFSAASLLVTHYTITSGSIAVVPNLNFESIIKRSRGPHGDMNRKFAKLPKNDPDYADVRAIQALIRQPGIGLVLNLHDGSGFYRPKRVSSDESPERWGQCVIIDKSAMDHASGDLEQRGEAVLREVNRNLLRPSHTLYLKNTLTHLGNPEMEKTLTWFAVRNNVPAFGIEASKSFGVDVRAFYHLLVIEAFLKQAGIGFERDFPLTLQGVAEALQSHVSVRFADGQIFLPMDDIRPRLLGTIPLPTPPARLSMSKPIMALVQADDEVAIHYGNRVLTRFKPEWHTIDTSLATLSVTVDGVKRNIHMGDIVDADKNFCVDPVDGVRINAIGAVKGTDESGITLKQSDFLGRFSIDKSGSIFRVEAYRGEHFSGMFLVRFPGAASGSTKNILPAIAGRETVFGY